MSKPSLFLETTIQILRQFGSRARQLELKRELAAYRLITSNYVYGEYLRTIVNDATALHRLALTEDHFDDLITAIGQHINKRQASRMNLILANVIRQYTYTSQSTTEQLSENLGFMLDSMFTNRFWLDIDEVINTTQCGLALEHPILVDDHYNLRVQCIRKVRECNLAEQMAAWQPQLRVLAEGLRGEKDQSLRRMGELAAQIIDDPILARGRNCTWYLGDMVIALTLPEDVPLYTTNRRHFEPLLALLGKQLHTP